MTRANSGGPGVVVIGAGACGLAVASALQRRGAQVEIIDQAMRVGEPWRGRHAQLRLNTHRWLSGLPGLAMPRSAGAFPTRDAVIRFLEDYANHVDVPLRFGVTVRRIDSDRHGWRIDTSAGELRARHVVVATGRDRVPHIPRWPGMESLGADIRHSADFGELSRYRGRRILVIGAGNSGSDVLNHLATIETDRIWVSVRHGSVVFPTRLYGVPVQLLSPVLERLPAPLVDRALAVTQRIAFGDVTRWGLRKHPAGGATRLLEDGTAPAIDNGFIRSLKSGAVEIVPEVEAFSANRVRLRDGRHIEPEIVICATGYRTGLEPMLGHLGVLDDRGAPAIDGAEQDSRYPGLWFVGMRPRLSGFFLAARRSARAIAEAIVAETADGVACSKWSDQTAAMTASRES